MAASLHHPWPPPRRRFVVGSRTAGDARRPTGPSPARCRGSLASFRQKNYRSFVFKHLRAPFWPSPAPARCRGSAGHARAWRGRAVPVGGVPRGGGRVWPGHGPPPEPVPV